MCVVWLCGCTTWVSVRVWCLLQPHDNVVLHNQLVQLLLLCVGVVDILDTHGCKWTKGQELNWIKNHVIFLAKNNSDSITAAVVIQIIFAMLRSNLRVLHSLWWMEVVASKQVEMSFDHPPPLTHSVLKTACARRTFYFNIFKWLSTIRKVDVTRKR